MHSTKAVFDRIDWELLRDQKLVLFKLLTADLLSERVEENLNGILNLIDAIQDAAEKDGFPVVFLTEDIRPRSELFDKEAPNAP